MTIGMRGHDLSVTTLAQLSATCGSMQVPTLQLALGKSVPGFRKGLFSPHYATQIRNTLAENKVGVTVLGCYINPSEADPAKLEANLSLFEEALKYAKFLGADMVGLETGYPTPETAHTEEAYQTLLTNMRRLVASAEKLGVMIGIEGVHLFVIDTPEMMRRLLDDLNSPNVCVIFDPCNYLGPHNWEEQDAIIERACRLLAEEFAVLHIKDFAFRNGEFVYTPPMQNGLHLEKLFSLLAQYKPNLPVILEEVNEQTYAPTAAAIEQIARSVTR